MASSWLLSVDLVFAALYSLFFYPPSDTRRGPVVWIGTLSLALYLFSNYLLIVALFVRLSGLFESGPLSISRRTTWFFGVVLALIPLLSVPNAIYCALSEMPWLAELVWGSSVWVLVIVALSALLTLFTNKLQQIQRNKTLNAFIRRQMMLAVLALVFVVLALVIFCIAAFRGQSMANHGNSASLRAHRVVMALLAAVSNLCNFMCIAISYRCCDSLIVLCCGWIRCCRVTPITTEDHDAIFLEQIMKNVPEQQSDRSPGSEGPGIRVRRREQSPNAVAAAGAAPLPPIVAAVAVGHPPAIGVQPQSDYDIIYEY